MDWTYTGHQHVRPSLCTFDSTGPIGKFYLFWTKTQEYTTGHHYRSNSQQHLAGLGPLHENAGNGDLEPAPIALKNGTLIMFFSQQTRKQATTFIRPLHGWTSGTWSTETAVTSSPAPSQSPTAIQDGSGKIWLAWTRQRDWRHQHKIRGYKRQRSIRSRRTDSLRY